jgi:hypothetical protein
MACQSAMNRFAGKFDTNPRYHRPAPGIAAG